MPKIICAISMFCVIFTAGPAFPAEKKSPARSKSSEIILAGKLFCSLKRPVVMHFKGIVTSLDVHAGQQVKEGEILARYRLDPEIVYRLRQEVLEFQIKDMEMKLEGVEKKLAGLKDEVTNRVPLESEIQLAEVDKGLIELEERRKEIKGLADSNMAPAHSVRKVERELELLNKKRALIRKGLPMKRKQITREIQLLGKKRTFLRERLPLERELFEEKISILSARLQNPVKPGRIEEEAAMTAPISGHVIWVSPELREKAEIADKRPVLRVGVMNPMLIRAQVHEIEAVKLKLGDVADFTTESIRGRKFEAKVSRLSWASMNPQLDKPSYYEVEFQVANPDFLLREGLRGQVVFRKH